MAKRSCDKARIEDEILDLNKDLSLLRDEVNTVEKYFTYWTTGAFMTEDEESLCINHATDIFNFNVIAKNSDVKQLIEDLRKQINTLNNKIEDLGG